MSRPVSAGSWVPGDRCAAADPGGSGRGGAAAPPPHRQWYRGDRDGEHQLTEREVDWLARPSRRGQDGGVLGRDEVGQRGLGGPVRDAGVGLEDRLHLHARVGRRERVDHAGDGVGQRR